MAKYTLQDSWAHHKNCEVVIYWKKFKDNSTIPGLYCKNYGIWIQWLDMKTADELILNGIEQILDQPKKKSGHPKH